MNFNRRKRVAPEVSMTSMVDVVLLLLFFFMVSTTFNQQTAIKLKLPEADSAETESTDAVTLTIDADGAYYVEDADGLPHELINRKANTLQQALRKFSATATQTPFIIKADHKTPHQAVITALEAASAAGFSHVSFATEQTPGQQ